jgi:hypothetical protein
MSSTFRVTNAAGPKFGTLSSRMLGYILYLREHFKSPGCEKARSLSDFPRTAKSRSAYAVNAKSAKAEGL